MCPALRHLISPPSSTPFGENLSTMSRIPRPCYVSANTTSVGLAVAQKRPVSVKVLIESFNPPPRCRGGICLPTGYREGLGAFHPVIGIAMNRAPKTITSVAKKTLVSQGRGVVLLLQGAELVRQGCPFFRL